MISRNFSNSNTRVVLILSLTNTIGCLWHVPCWLDASWLVWNGKYIYFIFTFFFSGVNLDHVTYGLWCTKILFNCSKYFKIVKFLILILVLIQFDVLENHSQIHFCSGSIIFLKSHTSGSGINMCFQLFINLTELSQSWLLSIFITKI